MNGEFLLKTDRMAMSLAEFLDSVADQEAANGNDTNAEIWRQRALQAKQQEVQLQQSQQHLRDATDRLADIRRTLQVAA